MINQALIVQFGKSFVLEVIWAAIVFAVLPLLMKVYGMPANHDVRLGSIFQLGFLLFFLVVFVLTIFYESTERFGMSLFLASIPDSVVYPLLLIAFIPHFQKLGIWYAQSFSLILGLFVSYVFLTLIAGKNNLYHVYKMNIVSIVVSKNT